MKIRKDGVRVTPGYDPGAHAVLVKPDGKGVSVIEIQPLERLTIDVLWNQSQPRRGGTKEVLVAGYVISGTSPGPLPVGSSLDLKKGIFYWQTGPAFLGDYEFVFITKGIGRRGREVLRKALVKVAIKTK